jgi:glyoxylase-like metal-dependent hydrolase (beta-lactamase superfamily II)
LIVPLHAGNPSPMTGAGNWTYFLPGQHPVLIDAGVGRPTHIEAMRETRGEGPGHVVVTHAHTDHISGATAIATRWPETRFSKYAWPERDATYAVGWAALNDGDVIPAGDSHLEVVHTPGHAPDHIALWHAATRTVFSGDLVVMGSTVVILATMGGSLTAYVGSLERVLALAPARLLPAHGSAIDNPELLIRQYIEHRRDREAQIRAALEDGVHTLDEMVARIYVGLSPALVGMARESVLAHLLKLQDEGIVWRDAHADRWLLQ